MKTERWRLPQGDLPCTLGNHTVPHTEFSKTSKGGLDSWCRACRRKYNTQLKADKRWALRNAPYPLNPHAV
jgi:hypothetical protein